MCAPIMTIIAEAPKKCMPRRRWPNGAWCVMNWSVSYASAVDGMYESASAIPVMTCSMNVVKVAVPNT